MSQRICSKCREAKPLDAFHRAKGQPQGRHRQCKGCRSELGKAERLARDSKHAERSRLLSQGLQRCTACAEIKALDHFYRSSRNKSGRKGQCIGCYTASGAEYRTRVDVTARYRERREQRRREDPDKYAEMTRNSYLRHRYGIDSVEYESMLEEQSGVCAICGSPPGAKPLFVDHCHETGVVRGLLCGTCNSGIGLLGDTSESVQAAVRYLESHDRSTA